MNLLQQLKNDKITVIALHALVQKIAKESDFTLEMNLKATCASAGVNRTQAYEKKTQITASLETIEIPGRGRPSIQQTNIDQQTAEQLHLKIKVLEFKLGHPGAAISYPSGRSTYSDNFKRYILTLLDEWQSTDSEFCMATGVPFRTLQGWCCQDKKGLLISDEAPQRQAPQWPSEANETCRTITGNYMHWEGTTREFLRYESATLNLPPSAILNVLKISKMISTSGGKPPRYRGTTLKATPGEIIVTDGKNVKVDKTFSGTVCSFNWQGIVDQATACHTAVIITDTECAKGVAKAYEDTKNFLGRAPGALLHDNKPIHKDEKLREMIEKQTVMIPATEGRPENKAVIEGEFGKFEQQIGTIKLDDTNNESLVKSAVAEIIRAYTAGINHAGRAEYGGKSRIEVLRDSCPDPEKDKKLIAELKASHENPRPADPLPSKPVSRVLLDEGFERLGLTSNDTSGRLREWLSSRYEPEAIRQGIAVFGTKKQTGALKGKEIHRYLVKVIQGCQDEINLRREEDLLRQFAQVERRAWTNELDSAFDQLLKESSSLEELTINLAEHAVFGGIFLERSFWESRLKDELHGQKQLADSVCKHLRRLYEANYNERFQLISKIVSWEEQLDNITKN